MDGAGCKGGTPGTWPGGVPGTAPWGGLRGVCKGGTPTVTEECAKGGGPRVWTEGCAKEKKDLQGHRGSAKGGILGVSEGCAKGGLWGTERCAKGGTPGRCKGGVPGRCRGGGAEPRESRNPPGAPAADGAGRSGRGHRHPALTHAGTAPPRDRPTEGPPHAEQPLLEHVQGRCFPPGREGKPGKCHDVSPRVAIHPRVTASPPCHGPLPVSRSLPARLPPALPRSICRPPPFPLPSPHCSLPARNPSGNGVGSLSPGSGLFPAASRTVAARSVLPCPQDPALPCLRFLPRAKISDMSFQRNAFSSPSCLSLSSSSSFSSSHAPQAFQAVFSLPWAHPQQGGQQGRGEFCTSASLR